MPCSRSSTGRSAATVPVPVEGQEAFITIGDLLRNTIAPPRVAAALYRAAALIPGVTLIPDATDAIGRPGVAVGHRGQLP